MRTRILSLIGALALCFVALAGVGTAQAACPSNFCPEAQRSCLLGCPCAIFTCDPVGCWADCSCPIICWD
jgi:hypothetical protein